MYRDNRFVRFEEEGDKPISFIQPIVIPKRYYPQTNTVISSNNNNTNNINNSYHKSTITHANFRNLNDTQLNITTKTPLKIDGLGTNTFNHIYPGIWNTNTSKIIVKAIDEIFIARVSLEVVPWSVGTTVTLYLDITSTSSLIKKDIEIVKLESTKIIETFTFYTGSTFLTNGGVLAISASEPIGIFKAAIHLIKLS